MVIYSTIRKGKEGSYVENVAKKTAWRQRQVQRFEWVIEYKKKKRK